MRVEVQTGGTSRGISDCRDGLSDLGMISRDLKEEEKKIIQAIPIARDGLAFVVNGSNQVRSLTKEQIVGIYKGQITNWKDVGGADLPITPVTKAEGRASLELFLHYFKLEPKDIKAKVVIGDEEQGLKTVSGSRGAIAYLGVASVEMAEKMKQNVHSIKFGNLQPTIESVRTGEYPLVRHLSLISCKKSSVTAGEFVKFASSEAGQKVVREHGFIPVR